MRGTPNSPRQAHVETSSPRRSRSWLPLVLVPLALGIGTSALAQEPTLEELLGKAQEIAASDRPVQALPYFERAAEQLESAGREAERATLLNQMGVLRFRLGEVDLAEDLYRQALEIQEAASEPDNTALATTVNNLAALQLRRGHPEAAEPLYRRALALRQAALPADHPEIAFSLTELATLCHGLGRLEEATDLYTQALAIESKRLADAPQQLVPRYTNLAVLHRLQGQPEKAEPLMQRAVELTEAALGADHPEVAAALNNQAVLASDLEQWDHAETLYRRALGIQERAFGENHFSLAMSLRNLASLYLRQGQTDEAVAATRRMDAVLDANCDLERGLVRTAEQRSACRDARLMHRQLARQLQFGGEGLDEPVPSTATAPPSSESTAAPDAPPTSASTPTTDGPVYRAQVKAYQEQELADEDVPRLVERFPAVLEGVPAHVVRVDLSDKGVWYRIQFGDFTVQSDASQLCRALERAGHSGCWVVRQETETP